MFRIGGLKTPKGTYVWPNLNERTQATGTAGIGLTQTLNGNGASQAATGSGAGSATHSVDPEQVALTAEAKIGGAAQSGSNTAGGAISAVAIGNAASGSDNLGNRVSLVQGPQQD